MNCKDLIAALSRDVRPVPRHALCTGWLGLRPDLMPAMPGTAFWIKCTYTIGVAICATVAPLRLSRPDGRAGGWLPAQCGRCAQRRASV